MKIRIASTLLALMLPLAAQDPAAAATNEAVFYKAFYLEKGPRDIAAAMVLYEQFLTAAPDHKLAKEAAEHQYALLGSTGKTKERDAFKAKYEKLLGNAAPTPAAGDRPAGGGADAPRGRGEGQGRPGGGGDPAARMAELEKQLAKAKEEGNAEEVKKIEAQIERAKQMSARGGQGGPGGRGAGFGALRGTKKISEMTPEEVTQLKEVVGQSQGMVDRMRQGGNEEGAKKLETSLADLKKHLDANKLDEAQKSLDAIRAAMPARRGGGGGGGNGGGGGGNGGGGGGNGGGGGGTGTGNGGGGGGGGGR